MAPGGFLMAIFTGKVGGIGLKTAKADIYYRVAIGGVFEILRNYNLGWWFFNN
jgi:hypothetical protein